MLPEKEPNPPDPPRNDPPDALLDPKKLGLFPNTPCPKPGVDAAPNPEKVDVDDAGWLNEKPDCGLLENPKLGAPDEAPNVVKEEEEAAGKPPKGAGFWFGDPKTPPEGCPNAVVGLLVPPKKEVEDEEAPNVVVLPNMIRQKKIHGAMNTTVP